MDVRIIQVGLSALGPFCAGDPAQALSPTPTGGILSGTGVVAGDFDPTVAGREPIPLLMIWRDALQLLV